ncbi:MAG: transporter ATP-binding protein [Agromyces sp.]|jgi:iron complex transport system ATP-binding protein|nr:transporter ATP-binding protein [Agromyces sp.]
MTAAHSLAVVTGSTPGARGAASHPDSIGDMASTVLAFNDVSVVRDGNAILDSINWTVESDERWVILGPNGAGKTTLLQIAAAAMHPTKGTADVLQEALGKVDVFELRPMIGFASTAMARKIPRNESVLDTVLTAAYSVTGRWNEEYEEIDLRRANRVLKEWGLEGFAERRFGSLSDGEQKRVQIARSVMTDPELLLLDEPAASLDLGAREELVGLLGGYASSPASPAIIMVTHHVEEIPPGFTHAMLLSHGKIVTAGPVAEALTSESLTETFGIPIELTEHDQRFAARAAAA